MILRADIQITTIVLGDKNHNGVMRFARSDLDNRLWTIPPAEWFWLLDAARGSLHLPEEVSTNLVMPPPGITLPCIHLYERLEGKAVPWRRGDVGKRIKHEAIYANTKLQFEFAIAPAFFHPSGGSPVDDFGDDFGDGKFKRPPTLQEMADILKVIGTHLGISPWGRRFLKGRFSLLGLTDIHDTATTSDNSAAGGLPGCVSGHAGPAQAPVDHDKKDGEGSGDAVEDGVTEVPA